MTQSADNTHSTSDTHHSNVEGTLSQLLDVLDNVLHSGDWFLPADTGRQLKAAYRNARDGLGAGEPATVVDATPLARATTFSLPDGTRLEEVKGSAGVRWAVRDQFNSCLNKGGEWEYEPSPSNRDDEFFERCRWDTKEAAYTAWEAARAKH